MQTSSPQRRFSPSNAKIDRRHSTPPFAPTFIVGCPRSGTTLLAACLDRHSQFAVMPETHFLTQSYRHSRWALRAATILAATQDNTRLADSKLDLSRLGERFLAGPASHARMFQLILEEYAAIHQKFRAAEKTPDHLRFTPTILRWYPHAKIVCIQRDGRDVALSLRQVKWASDNLKTNARRWCADAELGLRFRAQHPDRFHWVRFEDLVRDPTTSLTAIMRFLGCDFESRQIDATQPTGVVPAWESAWKAQANQAPTPSKVQAWKTTATAEEIRLMNTEMNYYLARCGYSDATLSAGLSDLLPPSLAPAIRRFAEKAARSVKRRVQWVKSHC